MEASKKGEAARLTPGNVKCDLSSERLCVPLSVDGKKMCIRDRYLVEAGLRRVDILEYFEFILTCTEVGAGKDRPDIYETALRRLGTGKETTYVFAVSYTHLSI